MNQRQAEHSRCISITFYVGKAPFLLLVWQHSESFELGGEFEIPEWPEDPGCVYTCKNFPNVPKMKKVSKKPILAGRAIEYVCKNNKKIPHTGERFFINCTDIGKFEGELENFPGTDWPECVTGCVDFPELENFKPLVKFYKLPNDTIEYGCSKGINLLYTKKHLGVVWIL